MLEFENFGAYWKKKGSINARIWKEGVSFPGRGKIVTKYTIKR